MRIFLGYPSEHEKAAWEVYSFLTALGDDVWFDKKSLVAGTEWDRERDAGQRQAELVIHLYSESMSRRPGVVHRELRQTLELAEDQPLGTLFVISIRLDDTRLPVELTRFQYIDFDDSWREKLAAGVAKRRTQLQGNPIRGSKQTVIEGSIQGFQKIEVDEVTEAYECHGEYFRYREEDVYWTYVNGAIASQALGGYFGLRGDFKRWHRQPTDEMKNVWSLKTEEFFRAGEMLSIRFYTYASFVGAAHGNHWIRTLNFFGKDAGSLRIDQLLTNSSDQAKRIMTYCENVIVAGSEGSIDKTSFFENSKDEQRLWNELSHFGFDKKGLTFNFSPYAILAYAVGSHEVLVPWRLLEVAPEYRGILSGLV